MSNIVVPVLSVTIGLFFVLVGTIKLTPFISEEFYKEMVGFNDEISNLLRFLVILE